MIWRSGGVDEVVVDVTTFMAEEAAERVWGFVRGRQEYIVGEGAGRSDRDDRQR